MINVFTGNLAPFHITQPSTDYDVQIVSPTATMATLTCSLNVTIPQAAMGTNFWIHNDTVIIPFSQTTQIGNTYTLLLQNLQPSVAGVYRCLFNDFADSGWILVRNIRLFSIGNSTRCSNVYNYSQLYRTKYLIYSYLAMNLQSWKSCLLQYWYFTFQFLY